MLSPDSRMQIVSTNKSMLAAIVVALLTGKNQLDIKSSIYKCFAEASKVPRLIWLYD